MISQSLLPQQFKVLKYAQPKNQEKMTPKYVQQINASKI